MNEFNSRARQNLTEIGAYIDSKNSIITDSDLKNKVQSIAREHKLIITSAYEAGVSLGINVQGVGAGLGVSYSERSGLSAHLDFYRIRPL